MKTETFDHADQSALLNTQQWTPEPWHSSPSGGARMIHSDLGLIIADTPGELPIDKPNAERIVACVNACTGIQEPEKAIQGAREAIQAALELIPVARQYFPKSVRQSDKFGLELTCAALSKALEQLGGKL